MGYKASESVLLKKPYVKTTFTEDQLVKFKQCADPVSGPLYFISNYIWVQHPTKGKIIYKPYDYQIRLIETYRKYNKSVALMPRQVGKTVTSVAYLLWVAQFTPDQTILIASNKFSSVAEIMDRIKFAYENLPDYIRCGVVEYNKRSIVFDNGSKIVAQATTPTTGRGMSVSLLYLDEFSFVRPAIAREFWASIVLTLSSGGKTIVTSTPNNVDDMFADIWLKAKNTLDEYGNTIPNGLGRNGFKAISCTWDEHPERDDKWASQQLALIGPERFAREIECKFIQMEETLINPFKLSELKGNEPLEVDNNIRWYVEPNNDSIYLIALDPSMGTGGDAAAIEVFDAISKEQVAEWVHNKTSIEGQIKILQSIAKRLQSSSKDVYYSIENNAVGEASLLMIRTLGEENIGGTFLSQTSHGRKGFTTSASAKMSACSILKKHIENGTFKLHSKALISELRNFVSTDATYRAKAGESDDLVSSTLVIVRMLEILKTYIPSIENSSNFGEDEMEENMPLPFSVTSSYPPLFIKY